MPKHESEYVNVDVMKYKKCQNYLYFNLLQTTYEMI